MTNRNRLKTKKFNQTCMGVSQTLFSFRVYPMPIIETEVIPYYSETFQIQLIHRNEEKGEREGFNIN